MDLMGQHLQCFQWQYTDEIYLGLEASGRNGWRHSGLDIKVRQPHDTRNGKINF